MQSMPILRPSRSLPGTPTLLLGLTLALTLLLGWSEAAGRRCSPRRHPVERTRVCRPAARSPARQGTAAQTQKRPAATPSRQDESATAPPAAPPTPAEPRNESSPSDLSSPAAWQSLFDGSTMSGWKSTSFGGEGEVLVEDGQLILEMGNSLTGANCTLPTPKTNYEIELEAQRVEGYDFFCGLTFPVGESHCSLIVGGWGGGVVGISSIDGRDASENETTQFRSFENGRWYKFRVRITDNYLSAWIDDENVIRQKIQGRRLSTRGEVDPSRPFGLAAWETKAAIRNIRLRELSAGEIGDVP